MSLEFPCRLDKFLSHTLELPRSKVKILIKKSSVTINDIRHKKGDASVLESDNVMVDNERVQYHGLRYFMLNKPQGFVCANQDELHPTVFELIQESGLKDCHVAGRLDIDTTGLVLITNDGQWSHQITAPKKQKFKTYLVETEYELTETALQELESGVLLNGEKNATLPAKVEYIDKYSLKLSICEGKYHQVKRMLAAVNNKVIELHRESIGEILLDSNLDAGEYRELTQSEIDSISQKPG